MSIINQKVIEYTTEEYEIIFKKDLVRKEDDPYEYENKCIEIVIPLSTLDTIISYLKEE